jgi:hypothetical protein
MRHSLDPSVSRQLAAIIFLLDGHNTMAPTTKRQRVTKQLVNLPDTNKSTVLRIDKICAEAGHSFDQDKIESSITLHNILSPLDSNVFLQHCLRQCAVHIPGKRGEDRFQLLREHLFDLDPGMLLRETSSDNVFVWLKQPNGLIHSIEISDPDTALALLKSGHATYCRAPSRVEQHLVSSLLAQTGLGCGQYDPTGLSTTCLGRGEVEVFISTPGHQTNWHYDFQENFTLQLSGVKRWTLQRGTIQHPLRGCTPHYASPESVEAQLKSARLSDPSFAFGHPQDGVNAMGAVEEVTLRPGDVLYFPAGMWHKIDVIEPGVSINISLMASNYADVTCQALKHVLLKQDDWRESVTNNVATNVVDRLKELMKSLPGIIENLEQDNLAEGIIPPSLRVGRVIQLDDEFKVDEEEEDDTEDDNDDAYDERSDVVRLTPAFIEEHALSMIEIRKRSDTMALLISPLGSLMKEDEIRGFYNDIEQMPTETGDDAGDDTDLSNLYRLNVNFAGNDSHESVVRQRIRFEGQLLQRIHEFSKHADAGGNVLPVIGALLDDAGERAMLGFLIHHGYLVWRSTS